MFKNFRANGKQFDFQGNNIDVVNGRVYVDGKLVDLGDLKNAPVINITVEGDVGNLSSQAGDVSIGGNAGSVQTHSGDVTIAGSVAGNVSTMSGDVRAGKIEGSAKTMSGDIIGR